MKLSILSMALMGLMTIQSQLLLDKPNSSISILGTSTVHDWESTVKNFDLSGSKEGQSIKKLELIIPTLSISSGKSIMDDKTYDALKQKQHPNIIFKADHLSISGATVSGQGKLTLAGQTETIAIEAKVVSDTGSKIQIKGSHQIDMTQYGIKAPTAMFGSIVTGEEVTIQFDITLNY